MIGGWQAIERRRRPKEEESLIERKSMEWMAFDDQYLE